MDTLFSKREIPIIDLLHCGTAEAPSKCCLRRVATQLNKSLSEKGLALLVNHGIPEEKLRAVYGAVDNFCELPPAVRDTYIRTPPSDHGYVPPGIQQRANFDDQVEEIRHTFNVSRLDRDLPESEVPGFQEVVTSLGQDMRRLAAVLLRAVATSLDLPQDYFLATHSSLLQDGNASCLRLLYYPPFGAPPTPGVTRCGEHTDCGTFTLLAQDCEGGLEMLTKNNKWCRVGHLPGAILINTGELLDSCTKGRYAALRHRVVVPEQPMIRCKGRHSVAFFVHPDDNTSLQPIEMPVAAKKTLADCVASMKKRTKQNSIYTAYQHLQMRFRETYAS